MPPWAWAAAAAAASARAARNTIFTDRRTRPPLNVRFALPPARLPLVRRCKCAGAGFGRVRLPVGPCKHVGRVCTG